MNVVYDHTICYYSTCICAPKSFRSALYVSSMSRPLLYGLPKKIETILIRLAQKMFNCNFDSRTFDRRSNCAMQAFNIYWKANSTVALGDNSFQS